MEELKALIKVMRLGEKRMLKHMLSRTTNDEENLRYRLFSLLDKQLSEEDLNLRLTKMFGELSSSSFSHLKSRLKEDILSVFLVKESSKRIAQSNRAAQFECMKKIAQAYVLIFRGAKTEGASILNSARELAVKYELAAELVTINHITREALYSFSDVKKLNEVNRHLRTDLQTWSDILRSEELSFYITLPQLKSELLDEEAEGFDAKLISELRELYEKSGAARVGFWYYMAEVENCTSERRFNDAISSGLLFHDLVRDNPSVYSKNNMAGVNQTLGFAYLNLRQFEEAIDYLSNAQKLFPSTGFNRLQCLQYLVQAEIANLSLAEASSHIDLSLSHPRIASREALIPKWLYYRACQEFLAGEVDLAMKTMNKDGYLMRQQDDWNIQFRLLEMIILIEQKEEEWLEFKLDATRKFLTRHKKLDTPRVRSAIEIISNLLRKGLDFEQISEKNLASLASCLAEDPGFEWSPVGPELVRFDLWVKSMLPAQAE